jgi:hypothetical protein
MLIAKAYRALPVGGALVAIESQLLATALRLPFKVKSEPGAFCGYRFPVRTAKEKTKFLQIGPVLPCGLKIPDVLFRPLFAVVNVWFKGCRRRRERLPILHGAFRTPLVRHGRNSLRE